MSAHRFCLPILVGTVLSGCCHSHGLLVKRDSELNCPTDIRRTVPWCAGEDAIFRCPCGPADEFYGHKPTCWRTWPAPATVWRDSYCSGQPCGGQTLTETGVPTSAAPEMIMLPPTIEPVVPGAAVEGAQPPQLEELPPTSNVLEPSGGEERPREAVAGSLPPDWRMARRAGSAAVATELEPRQAADAIPAAPAPRRNVGEAPTALPPRLTAEAAPDALAPRRTSAAAPKALAPRYESPRSINVPPAPQFAVNPVAYALAPGIDVGEPSEAEQVVDAAHSEEAATAESGGASLAVVELPPAANVPRPGTAAKPHRRSLLDAFISPADEEGGQEAAPQNWNLVR